MNIKTANTLFDQGIFSAMYKAGFITTKVFIYREIYLWVQAQVKARGITKNQAVLEAEVKFEKDERTIWRALNCFTDGDKQCHHYNKIILRPLIYANQHDNH